MLALKKSLEIAHWNNGVYYDAEHTRNMATGEIIWCNNHLDTRIIKIITSM